LQDLELNKVMEKTSTQAERIRVQIFIPCFNSRVTLLKAVESILAQTMKNYEVILVDNASSDDSNSVFLALDDDRFSVVRFEENVSLGANFNRCIELASAEFFCIMHADDEYDPNYLENMIYSLDHAPSVSIAFCNANIIDEDSRRRFSVKNEIKRRASKMTSTQYAGRKGILWLADYNKVIAPSVMFRTSSKNLFGTYRMDLKFTLDWDLYFRILQEGGKILHVSQTLFNYRVHKNQQTEALIASMDKYYEMRAILDRIYAEVDKLGLNLGARKYRSLRLTIFTDATIDIFRFDFYKAKQKFLFLKAII
jgi:glycosyltransferase involved in cell wall biosynthesis